jgi:D-ribose pyranose/furanose isomerase RbsD
MVVTMPGVTETFKSVIEEMTHETDLERVNLLHLGNSNQTHNDLNTSIYKTENRWNIHHVSYDMFPSRAKQ